MANNSNRRVLAALLFLDLLNEEEESCRKKKKRVKWVRSWLARREDRGIFHVLARELAVEDETAYRNFFRVDKDQFQFLLDKIAHMIRKSDTVMRSSIKPEERLGVTLRFLATGETFQSLEKGWRISRTLISTAVQECCEAIYQILGPVYLKTPNTEEEWSRIANLFERR